jgi:D-tyrosyl-tRNA(Tyr) deacylase
MRLIVQRVSSASVTWREHGRDERRSIGPGFAILVGSGVGDSEQAVARLAAKIAGLRTFPDSSGRSNLSITEVAGEALVVSQFTLYADLARGRRPSFVQAGDPAGAERWVDLFSELLRAGGVPTQTGRFGAHMLVEIANDGPVTYALSTDDWATRV